MILRTCQNQPKFANKKERDSIVVCTSVQVCLCGLVIFGLEAGNCCFMKTRNQGVHQRKKNSCMHANTLWNWLFLCTCASNCLWSLKKINFWAFPLSRRTDKSTSPGLSIITNNLFWTKGRRHFGLFSRSAPQRCDQCLHSNRKA